MTRRRHVLGVFATSGLALAGGILGLFPEARLLRADAASTTLGVRGDRSLRGHLLTPSAHAREAATLRASPTGHYAFSALSSAGLAEDADDGFSVSVDWSDGTDVGVATLVPFRTTGRRGLLVRRRTPDEELVGLAIEREGGRIDVLRAAADGILLEATLTRRADGSILARGADGREQVIPPPPTSGRKGLASPLADDSLCYTLCSWYTTVQCATFWALVGLFTCAVVTLDTLGTAKQG